MHRVNGRKQRAVSWVHSVAVWRLLSLLPGAALAAGQAPVDFSMHNASPTEIHPSPAPAVTGRGSQRPVAPPDIRRLISSTQTELNAIRKASTHSERMMEERDHLVALMASLRLEVGRLEALNAVRGAGRRQFMMAFGAGVGVLGIAVGLGLSRFATRGRSLTLR